MPNERESFKKVLESDKFEPGLYTARSVLRRLIVLGTAYPISSASMDMLEQIIEDSPWWRLHPALGRSGWQKRQVIKEEAEQIASRISSATIRAELASNWFRPGESYSMAAIVRGISASVGLGQLTPNEQTKISGLVKRTGWAHNGGMSSGSRWTKPSEDIAPIPEPKPTTEDCADARLVRIEAMLQAICLELSIHLTK